MKRNLVDREDSDLLHISCQSSLLASLEYQPLEGASFKTQLIAEKDIHNFVWGVVNKKHFMEQYLKLYTLPMLKNMLRIALKSNQKTVSMELPVGKVFFGTTMILNQKRKPYRVEPHIRAALLNTYKQQIKEWSRRLGKSHYMKTDALYYSVFDEPCYSLYTCQSWDVSKEHLRIVQDWLDINPLLYRWAGGELMSWRKQKNSDSDKFFMNGSHISCRTATRPQQIAGKGINRLYEDEKALYPLKALTEEISILTKGQPIDEQEKFAHIICSAPAGVGTLFDKMLHDPLISRFWDISTIPICKTITFKKEIIQGELTFIPEFHGIITPRLTQFDLLQQWIELGQDKFLEQYMLHALTVEDRAVPDDVIEQFFNRDMPIKWSSDLPCICSYDLGKTVAHRSIVEIGEMQPSGQVFIVRILKFKPKTPIRTKGKGKRKRVGVIDTIPILGRNYNIQWIVGDTQTMGTDEPLEDLAGLMRETVSPVKSANIVPFKWAGVSEEFMGKAPLWYNLILPHIQRNMIKSIFDDDFFTEMRTWKAVESPTGMTIQLKPAKSTLRDDMITTMMQLGWVAFKKRGTRPSHSRATSAVSSVQGRKVDSHVSRRFDRRGKGRTRWRDRHREL